VFERARQTAFTYDDAGRPLTTTLANGVVGTLSYDDASHVTSIVYTKGATTVGELTYSYDAAGHRVTAGGSLARVSLPAAVATTTYNADNQLTKWNSNAVQPTYDANGNMLTDGTYTYSWNARSQLVQLKQGTSVIATYSHDATGRRIGKTISGATTGFSYDGGNFTQEKDASGTPTANLVTGGTDQTFSRTDGSGARYFLTDALGSTVALTDAAGLTALTSYTYEPYGKTTVTGSANGNTQQFTGRENDGPLYYYRARYLHPTFGRFVSEDPARNAASGPNLYVYGNGDPTNYTDPSGNILPIVGACALGAVFSVTVDLVANFIGGRKSSLGGVATSAASGCLSGVAGFGLGKLIGLAVSRAAPVIAASIPSAVPALAQVTINRVAGKAAESWLAQTYGGAAKTIVVNGVRRVIDNLTPAGIAQEAKVGYTTLSKFVASQVAKDAELLATQRVASVQWHFWESSTGIGPSAPLENALKNAGIDIFYH
jgi:RHS repeat-associated protein